MTCGSLYRKSPGNVFKDYIFDINRLHWSKCTVEWIICLALILKSVQARCDFFSRFWFNASDVMLGTTQLPLILFLLLWVPSTVDKYWIVISSPLLIAFWARTWTSHELISILYLAFAKQSWFIWENMGYRAFP